MQKLKNKKITFFSPNFSFITPLILDLAKDNNIKIYDFPKLEKWTFKSCLKPYLVKDEMLNLLKNSDIAFFEWCSELVWELNNLPKVCKIICRIHSNEVFVGKILPINWNKIDQVIFTNINVCNLTKTQVTLPKYTIIHHGTDLQKFNIPKNKKYGKKIAHVGHIHHKKNTPLLLYCFKKIYEWDSEYTLYAIGGFQEPRMQLYLEYFKLEHKLPIYIENWTNDIVSWYKDKDYLLNSSLFEGCFYSGTEAMACGVIPLIHNWYGSKYLYPKEYIYDDPDTCLSLIQKISKMNRTNLIQKNRKFIEYNYDIKDTILRIKKIMCELLNDRE